MNGKIDGLVQDYSIYSVLATEMLQSCTKLLKYHFNIVAAICVFIVSFVIYVIWIRIE